MWNPCLPGVRPFTSTTTWTPSDFSWNSTVPVTGVACAWLFLIVAFAWLTASPPFAAGWVAEGPVLACSFLQPAHSRPAVMAATRQRDFTWVMAGFLRE